ncbi:hypothetical protein, conserved [Plasmodium gonderi]|uniref:Uncharacterized protein n=1 Tax=Plasmodium gonderi TaxID=77519 RepID=A0A1Y1JMG7_PLAGO|nr:hypothetical protein, conserved [Plasmodium gonderi]GAW83786.1 hypothetical protein, conserved [Plasmodium gonderi]
MSSINKSKGKEEEEDIVDKLNYKNLNDVMLHELNCLKPKRQVYIKKGGTFFLSSREEALSVLKIRSQKQNQPKDSNHRSMKDI